MRVDGNNKCVSFRLFPNRLQIVWMKTLIMIIKMKMCKKWELGRVRNVIIISLGGREKWTKSERDRVRKAEGE